MTPKIVLDRNTEVLHCQDLPNQDPYRQYKQQECLVIRDTGDQKGIYDEGDSIQVVTRTREFELVRDRFEGEAHRVEPYLRRLGIAALEPGVSISAIHQFINEFPTILESREIGEKIHALSNLEEFARSHGIEIFFNGATGLVSEAYQNEITYLNRRVEFFPHSKNPNAKLPRLPEAISLNDYGAIFSWISDGGFLKAERIRVASGKFREAGLNPRAELQKVYRGGIQALVDTLEALPLKSGHLIMDSDLQYLAGVTGFSLQEIPQAVEEVYPVLERRAQVLAETGQVNDLFSVLSGMDRVRSILGKKSLDRKPYAEMTQGYLTGPLLKNVFGAAEELAEAKAPLRKTKEEQLLYLLGQFTYLARSLVWTEEKISSFFQPLKDKNPQAFGALTELLKNIPETKRNQYNFQHRPDLPFGIWLHYFSNVAHFKGLHSRGVWEENALVSIETRAKHSPWINTGELVVVQNRLLFEDPEKIQKAWASIGVVKYPERIPRHSFDFYLAYLSEAQDYSKSANPIQTKIYLLRARNLGQKLGLRLDDAFLDRILANAHGEVLASAENYFNLSWTGKEAHRWVHFYETQKMGQARFHSSDHRDPFFREVYRQVPNEMVKMRKMVRDVTRSAKAMGLDPKDELAKIVSKALAAYEATESDVKEQSGISDHDARLTLFIAFQKIRALVKVSGVGQEEFREFQINQYHQVRGNAWVHAVHLDLERITGNLGMMEAFAQDFDEDLKGHVEDIMGFAYEESASQVRDIQVRNSGVKNTPTIRTAIFRHFSQEVFEELSEFFDTDPKTGETIPKGDILKSLKDRQSRSPRVNLDRDSGRFTLSDKRAMEMYSKMKRGW